jgi:hypothetical protein
MQEYNTLTIPQPSQSSPAGSGADTPRTWLERWPTARRSLISNLFHYAARAGATTPVFIISAVQVELHRRLRYARPPFDATDDALHGVLQSLQNAPSEAYVYAQTVLDWEALPYDERQRQKQAHGRHFQEQYMATLPVTGPQLRYLHSLHYIGEVPANRLEASKLIAILRSAQGKGRP